VWDRPTILAHLSGRVESFQMLKALELVGFKSFADKTRFEFPSGISAIVGPNGSGKSNVVDAVKWVLGEQSVKSLRGKEMADVIFNGSGGRPPLNSAEATLTFDNAEGLLPIDTPEVHITRRVYRSGEGEYLINRQPSRLRDIRDLFTGTGAATEAYSVIEQGKVDVLLQASPKDRRAIFEEAAGISRFKAKKLDAQRRLERVDQNLLRLADIVEEVDNRLRGVQKQAAKARRYKQYTDRLQALRTQVGLADWRHLTAELDEVEQRLGELSENRQQAEREIGAHEQEALRLEEDVTRQAELLRETESRAAEVRQRIASRESAIDHESRRVSELERQMARHRQQLAGMNVRAGDLEQQLRETNRQFEIASDTHRQAEQKATSCQEYVAELQQKVDTSRQQGERRRAVYMQQMQAASALSNRITALETQLVAIEAAKQRSRQRLSSAQDELTALGSELERLERHETLLAERRAQSERAIADWRQRGQEIEGDKRRWADEMGQLRQQYTRATERARLLEQLERQQEGIESAVRQLLDTAKDADEPSLAGVHGLLAQQFDVPLPYAAAIEEALGELAGYLVVDRTRDVLAYVESRADALESRLGLVGLDHESPTNLLDEIDLTGRPGVVGRADRLLTIQGGMEPLLRRLLGRTWVVEQFAHATSLAEGLGRGLQFVTLGGERIRPDGTLLIGARDSGGGLITRRSELASLGEEVGQLEARMAELTMVGQRFDDGIRQAEDEMATLTEQRQTLLDELAELTGEIKSKRARESQLGELKQSLEEEHRAALARHESESEALTQARQRREETEQRLAEFESELAQQVRELEQFENRLTQATASATTAQVNLAKSEERLDSLRGQLTRLKEDRRERQRAIDEHRQRTGECQQGIEQAQRAILAAESDLAELYLSTEDLGRNVAELNAQRAEMARERSAIMRRVQTGRNRLAEVDKKIHAEELSASEIRLRRDNLASRLRDDYDVELAELEHEPTAEEQHQREKVDQEIAELRRKINNIGNVNLDALEELEELEDRFQRLTVQHADLTEAKNALEQIIDRINADSRRLFAETLEVVRQHFQGLFRKLFGGGHADIVLDEGVDLLDSGIEIVARPPGKEPRSISLLSGGEKTLTCVALLLAIFRSRPTPFCVLDEVDAALDEANIERFIAVLKEFLAWTQFIIVTHSKKTMTCASTLYGVTMQESGISKRVSVRFDDSTDHAKDDSSGQHTSPTEVAGDDSQAA